MKGMEGMRSAAFLQDFPHGMARVFAEIGVAVVVGDQRFPQGPAARPGDRAAVQTAEKNVPFGRAEIRPGHRVVAGGVPGAEDAEIDEPAEAALAQQDVPGRDVAVHPDVAARVRLRDAAVPYGGEPVDGQAFPQFVQCGAGFLLVDCRAAAAVEIVRAAGRSAGAVDLLQLFQRGGQRAGQRGAVRRRFVPQRAALDPAVYGPEIRVLRAGVPDGERCGNRVVELRLQVGQPAAFLLHLCLVGLAARQANGHRVAEVKGPVVVPAFFHGAHREILPLWELFRNQILNEFCRDNHTFAPTIKVCETYLITRGERGQDASHGAWRKSRGEKAAPARLDRRRRKA